MKTLLATVIGLTAIAALATSHQAEREFIVDLSANGATDRLILKATNSDDEFFHYEPTVVNRSPKRIVRLRFGVLLYPAADSERASDVSQRTPKPIPQTARLVRSQRVEVLIEPGAEHVVPFRGFDVSKLRIAADRISGRLVRAQLQIVEIGYADGSTWRNGIN